MSRFFMVFATLVTLLGATVPDALAADPTSRVVYGGRLEDAQGRPVGGIYPLTFSFYRTEKGGRAMWSEAHFVAVDNGLYGVELGREKPFPRTLDLTRAFISVSVNGKEIVRDRFAPEAAAAPEPAAPAQPKAEPAVAPAADPAIGAPPQAAKGTYADLAGFAYEAEKAKTADSVGGLTAVDLRNLIKQSTAAETPKETQKVRIGEAQRFTEQVGGLGGQPFTLQCPPGHVVTGIRGQAAGYVDQIALICSPLE